jgi:type II secretory pathway component PulF
MAQFTYKARRRSGELVQDVVEAQDRPGALAQIERLGLFPMTVELARGSAARLERNAGRSPAGGNLVLPAVLRDVLKRKRRPKLQELATFTQQLTNLLKAGMPLASALHSMTHLESKGIPADVSRQLKQDVMEGKGLSDSMAKQGWVFSGLYVNMVRAGEQSGALVDVLQRLASHFERFAEVQQKFLSALIYPAVVCCVGLLIMVFFMTFMLPKFMTIFEGMKMELPPATKALMSLSHIFAGYWWLIPVAGVAVAIVYNRYKSNEAGARSIDRFKMNAPILGRVVRLNLFGQFARTLGTLLQNGVPVLTALRITEQVMPNRVVREAIAKTREEVTDGKTIAQPLARSKIFPQLMIDLIKIGEETGDVPGALNNVAHTYENELAIALRVLTNLIEPAMIIVMAVGVGFLLFSVLSAMFAITANIAR